MVLFLLLLILPRLMCIWIKCIYQNNEYKADDYACKNIDNPLRIVSVFEQAKYYSKNKKDIQIFAFIVCSKLAHPSIDYRISRIKKNHNRIIILE